VISSLAVLALDFLLTALMFSTWNWNTEALN
jgi:hypothetical protein